MVQRYSWSRLLMLAGFVLMVVLSGCSSSTGGGQGGAYYAVVVGISNYQISDFNLRYADDDAMGFAQALIAGSNWDWGTIILLVNEEGNKMAIRESIFSTAARMSPEDNFVFYFSGHGDYGPDIAPFDEGDGLDETLVPYDALRNSTVNDIRDDEFETWLSAIPSSNVAIIIDASFSGGMFKGVDRGKSMIRPFQKDLMGMPGPDGIMKDVSRPGYIILTASDDRESPYESSILGHGVFTYFILKGLTGTANVDGNSYISVEEIYDYAAPEATNFSISASASIHPQMSDLHSGQYNLVKLR